MNQVIKPKELENFLSQKEIGIFAKLQNLLKQLNKQSNLTRLTEGNDYWISQVYDSIWPFIENKQRKFDNQKYIDIGSGCGFPGLAYAITHENSEIYLIDSSRKKTDALKEIVEGLKLKNKITIIKDRIENVGQNKQFRNQFDLATTRAVSSPSTVSEYILPMLKSTGKGIIYCGRLIEKDRIILNRSLDILKGSVEKTKKNILSNNKGERNIVFIKPEGICPNNFPRKVGKPKKYPLGN